jgi:hypothetical protein
VALAFGSDAIAAASGNRESASGARAVVEARSGQSWSPAVADIIGARRAWTVAMIFGVDALQATPTGGIEHC